ncbi:MAG: stage II sporulation protein P [Clostridia bacterium]|nr:stage II sporulation protein P [Clostridia bacterium]
MSANSKFMFWILPIAGILFMSYILPHLPQEFFVGTAYAAYGIEQGYSSYPEFVYNTFLPQSEQTSAQPVQKLTNTPAVTISHNKTQTYNPDYTKIAITNETSLSIDILKEMQNYTPPVKKTDAPQILIVHTHATESFSGTDNRTTDCTKNMVAIGQRLAEKLSGYGFSVLHDKTLHDYPNYNGSYVASAQTVEQTLSKYPSIEIVLDLHRDGIAMPDGTKVPVLSVQNGTRVAQMMLVVGTNTNLEHANWKENLKFAVGLYAATEQLFPGVMRPLNIRKERFNQQLSSKSLIVEIGSNGNTLQEAQNAADVLAEAIHTYIR